jgi:hypothetical protein
MNNSWGWRAGTLAPPGYFHTNNHFLAYTTKHENVSRKVAKIAKGELKISCLFFCVFARNHHFHINRLSLWTPRSIKNMDHPASAVVVGITAGSARPTGWPRARQ